MSGEKTKELVSLFQELIIDLCNSSEGERWFLVEDLELIGVCETHRVRVNRNGENLEITVGSEYAGHLESLLKLFTFHQLQLSEGNGNTILSIQRLFEITDQIVEEIYQIQNTGIPNHEPSFFTPIRLNGGRLEIVDPRRFLLSKDIHLKVEKLNFCFEILRYSANEGRLTHPAGRGTVRRGRRRNKEVGRRRAILINTLANRHELKDPKKLLNLFAQYEEDPSPIPIPGSVSGSTNWLELLRDKERISELESVLSVLRKDFDRPN